jgi:peptidyl-prolyl cis-trans isomerase A (cyclophilin A)
LQNKERDMRIFAGLIIAAFMASAALAQDAPPQPAAPPSGPMATIETSLGTIVIALDPVHAPVTVANFIHYAREKHFDGTVFYRVLSGRLIQAGSYDADGNPHGRLHKPIALEANNGLTNVRGSVAMAHGDPADSATAEFFIDTATLPSLDHQAGDTGNTTGFAVFGHVTSGMDVVDKIVAAPLGGKGPFPPDATPLAPVTIEKVTISGN